MGFYFRFLSHYAAWLGPAGAVGVGAQTLLWCSDALAAPDGGILTAAEASQWVHSGFGVLAMGWLSAMVADWRVVEAVLSYGTADRAPLHYTRRAEHTRVRG